MMQRINILKYSTTNISSLPSQFHCFKVKSWLQCQKFPVNWKHKSGLILACRLRVVCQRLLAQTLSCSADLRGRAEGLLAARLSLSLITVKRTTAMTTACSGSACVLFFLLPEVTTSRANQKESLPLGTSDVLKPLEWGCMGPLFSAGWGSKDQFSLWVARARQISSPRWWTQLKDSLPRRTSQIGH